MTGDSQWDYPEEEQVPDDDSNNSHDDSDSQDNTSVEVSSTAKLAVADSQQEVEEGPEVKPDVKPEV